MTERITIKTQSRDEGRDIITKLADVTALHANTGTEISFVLQPHADLMGVAKLLEVAKKPLGVLPTSPECNGKVLHAPEDRITIKTRNVDESRAVLAKIRHLVKAVMIHTTDIEFRPRDGVKLIEIAKQLQVTKSASPLIDNLQRDHDKSVFGGPRHNAPVVTCTPDPLACNLATQIAWLEGFSVVSECTGTFHCEIADHKNAHSRIKYDPIGRSAIWAELLAKYRVDCSWDVQGVDCEFKIYGTNKEGSFVILADSQLSDFGYCIGSAIVQVILSAERARK